MTVGLKLTLWLTLGTTGVLSVYGVLAVRREEDFFLRADRQLGEVLGNEVAARVASVWERRGKAEALAMLDAVDRRDEDFMLHWLPDASALSADQARLLARGHQVSVVREAPQPARVTYVPVSSQHEGAGVIEVVESIPERRAYVNQSIWRLILALVALAAINGLITLAISSWLVGRPVAKLVAKAKQVGQGDLSAPIELERNDELGRLADEMRRMSAELLTARVDLEEQERLRWATEEQLRHAERLATVGKLGAGMAHEIGTPLNVIAGRARRIEKSTEGGTELTRDAGIIREQAERISTILRQLLDFARQRGSRQQVMDLPRLVRHTVSLLESTIGKHRAKAEVLAAAEGLNARVDPTQMQQVLTNLILNAAQSMSHGGWIRVRLSARSVVPPSGSAPDVPMPCVAICVEDEGDGIAAENLPHIFEPFFTTKDVGEGTGLGLAVVHGIIADHGGWIDVESEPGRGSRFTVFLPNAETAEEAT